MTSDLGSCPNCNGTAIARDMDYTTTGGDRYFLMRCHACKHKWKIHYSTEGGDAIVTETHFRTS